MEMLGRSLRLQTNAFGRFVYANLSNSDGQWRQAVEITIHDLYVIGIPTDLLYEISTQFADDHNMPRFDVARVVNA